MENKKQFDERLEKLGVKLRIRVNTVGNYLKIEVVINGKDIYHKARYNENNKQEQFEKLSQIQQKLIKEFTVDWE